MIAIQNIYEPNKYTNQEIILFGQLQYFIHGFDKKEYRLTPCRIHPSIWKIDAVLIEGCK